MALHVSILIEALKLLNFEFNADPAPNPQPWLFLGFQIRKNSNKSVRIQK
jgi:hypothetical protein